MDYDYVRNRMLKDESIFNIATPESLMEQSWNTTQGTQDGSMDEDRGQSVKDMNTLTYAQRRKMQSTEKPRNGS
eukprot:9800782-Karenia_brevis.AAC.1